MLTGGKILYYYLCSYKNKSFKENIKNDNYEIQSLLDSLRDDLTEDMLIDEISRIESSIERIGPINLAAAEEYKLEEERNSEIDVQLIELNSALETLQSAIKKIDLESRTKFKDTLDKLNKDKKNSLDMVQSAIGGVIYGGGIGGIAKGLGGWFAGKLLPKNTITAGNKLEKDKNLIIWS